MFFKIELGVWGNVVKLGVNKFVIGRGIRLRFNFVGGMFGNLGFLNVSVILFELVLIFDKLKVKNCYNLKEFNFV